MGKKEDTCVYCGNKTQVTKDHIPPKNLFGQPRPNNLITAPSCYKCNSNFSNDDEYFRFSLSIRDDIFEKVQDIYPKVMRSLHKPNKIGFRKNFLKTIKPIEDINEAGIFRGYKYSYDVDISRLNKVASRIIKGLFFHHFKEILPQNYIVTAYCSEGMKNMPPDKIIYLQDSILIPISKQQLYNIKPIFEYKFIATKEDKYITAWLMSFFNKVYFLGITELLLKKA